MPFFFNRRLSAYQAKIKVFEHWKDLEAFAKRRFPNDENSAHEALDYSLEHLQDNDWERIRRWEGKGRFLTFLLTLTAHLLTDFTRQQYGHHRAPKWLLEQSDPIWHKAYKHLIIERYSRNETIEILQTDEQEVGKVNEIVEEILARCKIKIKPHQPQYASEEETERIGTTATEPLEELGLNVKELIEILVEFLTQTSDCQLPYYLEDHLSRLKSSISLDEEERMFLYLRYVEGKSMSEIVKLLNIPGNPYKRLNKLIERLRNACEQAGLVLDDMYRHN